MKEIWKDIEGFEGNFQISNEGRVKSLERKVNCRGGGYRIIKESILKMCINCDSGYYQTGLRKNRKLITKRIHILVAKAFIPNPNNLPYVCHKNDIKTDNRAENLYWGTDYDLSLIHI